MSAFTNLLRLAAQAYEDDRPLALLLTDSADEIERLHKLLPTEDPRNDTGDARHIREAGHA